MTKTSLLIDLAMGSKGKDEATAYNISKKVKANKFFFQTRDNLYF